MLDVAKCKSITIDANTVSGRCNRAVRPFGSF
jgi:hypothetical protein